METNNLLLDQNKQRSTDYFYLEFPLRLYPQDKFWNDFYIENTTNNYAVESFRT